MKVCILGAAGNTGRRLVRQALDRQHIVTAVVRRGGNTLPLQQENLTVRAIDYSIGEELTGVMRDHDVVICAAGYVRDPTFNTLIRWVVQAANEALGPTGRFWMFAGAALTDVPGTSIMTMDLPRMPKVFEPHRVNYNTVRERDLDWSILCPGPMIASPDGQATEDLVLSADIWPVSRPGYTRILPAIALSLAFQRALPRLTVYYEDAAKVVLDNLEKNGRFSRRRVGLALPKGITRHKENSSPAPADADRRA